ncbi:expressed unknown protein [Seminavis robusta]|uniref:Uncharacterized protein n=1 Tax=Seminavis robusta TaxID=568900 RepID=A0A9N8DUK4_9STRA|nr:expressed unknown protein [Seminavis robusta]|eukprot:Sro383_g131210.1 n/a (1275) ;mRNA; f:5081-9618
MSGSSRQARPPSVDGKDEVEAPVPNGWSDGKEINSSGNNMNSSLSSLGLPPAPGSDKRLTKPSPLAMKTIESSATDGYGSDQRPMQRPPGHGIFNSLYEDSDGSDGSIVFNSKRNKKPAPTHEAARGRERFPSFDSMASSGSLVRHVLPQHSTTSNPSPQTSRVTQQNMGRVNPQMLPYDQRRKLMQMKQKQQQQQPQKQRDRSPPQPPRVMDPRFSNPYMMTPAEFHQPPPNPYQINGMMVAPPQHFGYPMPPPQPMHMQMPFGAYPPSSPRLHPYRSPQQHHRHYDPQSRAMQQQHLIMPPGKQPGRPYPPPPQQQQVPPYPPPPQQHQVPPQTQQPQAQPQHSLPPKSNSRNSNNGGQAATKDKHLPASSIDSSEQDPKARVTPPPAAAQSTQTDPSSSSNNNGGTGVPPPPPPPPVPPHHVRAESSGSVSSLGSQGSVFGYVATQHEDNPRHPKGQRSGGRSDFLKMLNPFSTEKRQHSPKLTASDFHKKNQAFLEQSAATKRQFRKPPPQHRRVGSMDRPPATRGTHRRLPSIENDNWEETAGIERTTSAEQSSGDASSQLSTSDGSDLAVKPRYSFPNGEANERTSLLPPSGQGSSEHLETRRRYHSEKQQSSSKRHKHSKTRSSRRPHRASTEGNRNRESETTLHRNNVSGSRTQSRRKKKKSRRRARRRNQAVDGNNSGSSQDSEEHSSSSSSYDYRQWTRRRSQMLEDERNRLIAQWKAEARAEAIASRRQQEADQWYRRIGRYLDSEFGDILRKAFKVLSFVEAFICNLPLTVGGIAMAIVTLGVVWFKWVEENLDSCEPVQFHSSQCTFPEFPGCFYCDTTAPMYQLAVNFHFACSAFAGVLALSFVLKLCLAPQVFLDELSSPTTASPAGLICMTTVCVFAGRGIIGQIIVSLAACVHLCLVIWFIYMALAYHIMPDPSWFPNTVGIGMTAVKTWLYYPMSGHFLMALALSLNFFFFPISLVRVALNEKISAPVGYMQMSAPAVALMALTIMAQPSFEQEKPDINRFQRAHRLVYLPAMHALFVLSVIGFLASLQSLAVRWKGFKKKPFSPAHAAFPYPTLLHANAIQAYRAAINSFSSELPGKAFTICLDVYWIVVLVSGTILTIWISMQFFWNLPGWTNLNVDQDEEPPAPYETTMTLQNVIATGESLVQPFVSPAVLQANETGALVLVRRTDQDGGGQRFVRTRKLASLGFEPTMTWGEMERERDLLLEWIGKHPRRRTKTLSVPGIDFSSGLYMANEDEEAQNPEDRVDHSVGGGSYY